MYIFGYLRASTAEQDVLRAKDTLNDFVQRKGFRVASWFMENESGAILARPQLMSLLNNAAPGDAILVEQIDRLSRLNDEGWQQLKTMLKEKELKVIALDLPTSLLALDANVTDSFTAAILRCINDMMMDMLAATARKDYEDRRRRQVEGIKEAKSNGKYKGRKKDAALHQRICELRFKHKMSISVVAELTNTSKSTVIRASKGYKRD